MAISENFDPRRNGIPACNQLYTSLIDNVVNPSPGFCPLGNQPSYAITITFNRPSNEFSTGLVIWANVGAILTDYELRVFDLVVIHTDPATNAELIHRQTDVTLPDQIVWNVPVTGLYRDALGNPISLYGVKSVQMTKLRAQDSTGETTFREVKINGTIDTSLAANVQVTKTSSPYSGNPAPNFNTPGNDVMYSITVSNSGNQAADNGSVFAVDALPPTLTFFNGDADGPGPGTDSVLATNSGSGLTFTMPWFAFATTAPTSFAQCSYTPAAGYDPAVRYICIQPQGSLAGNSLPSDPSFTVNLRARIN